MEELHSAYKYILKAQENSYGEPIYEQTSEGEDKFDIKHTAPQHRQYLEYGGVGRGKPSARQKQYQQYRVGRAVENAQEFMIDKAIRESYNVIKQFFLGLNLLGGFRKNGSYSKET